MFVLWQAERLRKIAEQEKQEAVENMTQATNQVNTLTQAKRKLEQTISGLQEEAEDLENEAKNADDRAKKFAIEVRFSWQVRALAWLIFLRPLSLSAFIFGDYTTTKAQNVLEMADPACACDVSRQLMNCKVSAK